MRLQNTTYRWTRHYSNFIYKTYLQGKVQSHDISLFSSSAKTSASQCRSENKYVADEKLIAHNINNKK